MRCDSASHDATAILTASGESTMDWLMSAAGQLKGAEWAGPGHWHFKPLPKVLTNPETIMHEITRIHVTCHLCAATQLRW